MEMSLIPSADLVQWLLTLNMGTYTQTHTEKTSKPVFAIH